MIVEYHRPDSLDSAFRYIIRNNIQTIPLYGNIKKIKKYRDPVGVVDLQDLGLNKLEHSGNQYSLGAMLTLQDVLENDGLPPGLKKSILHEASYNLRNSTTIADALLDADGRSPFGTVMLALGAQTKILPDDTLIPLGELFVRRTSEIIRWIILKVSIPSNVFVEYSYVARTPADLPIVCVGVVKWPSGRTRVALGGYGNEPRLVMDGPDQMGAEVTARNAYLEAGDQWASSEYRSKLAEILTRRCLERLDNLSQK